MNNEKSDSFELLQENAAAMIKQIEQDISKTMDKDELYHQNYSEASRTFVDTVIGRTDDLDLESIFYNYTKSLDSFFKLLNNPDMSEKQAVEEQSIIVDTIESFPIDQDTKDKIIPKEAKKKKLPLKLVSKLYCVFKEIVVPIFSGLSINININYKSTIIQYPKSEEASPHVPKSPQHHPPHQDKSP